ncbi:C13 family peptidase, partial [Candidatus Venteria ishoeyi]
LEKNGNWTTYNTANVPTLQQNHIEKLISDGQGGLWLGTINGLYHAPALGAGISTDWTRYGTENSGLPDPWVFELLRDDKNGLWIGTNLGLAYFNPANNQWITNDEIASFPTAKIDALALDSHVPGHIWVSVDGAGLYTVHNSGANAFQPVLHTEITGTATIMDMISDGHGGLWLGIRGIGLRHLKKESGNWVFEAEEGFVQDLQARVIVPDWQPTGTAADLANLTEAERASIPVDNFGNPATLNGYWLGTKAEFGHIDLISRDALGNPTTVGLLDEFGHLTTSASVFEKIYPAIEYSDSALTQAVAATVPFHVNTAISDGEGGVYIGSNDGLMHLDKNRNVLPVSNNITDPVTTLLLLENKTLFVGTSEGLYLRKLDGGWVFFNTNNSNLLSNDILSLFVDEANTVWVWSRAGHVSYTTDYARWTSQGVIPSLIRAVVPDNTGGFWVSSEQGLDHVKNVQSALEVESFNEGLPNSDVRALISDTVGGLYIATSGGLAHLNFSEQADLIQRISAGSASDNESLIEELSSGERAAILIQPRGQGEGYQQEVSISFMASYAYKTLRSRGFKHSDIYFLTYEPGVDINGDGMQDRNAVDGPVTFKQFANGTDPRDLTIDDVRTAFAWAKDKGGLTQPLTVIFVDHGDAEQLLLDPFEERLTGGEFSSILDDYQQTTGNQAVVFIEACYSGTLIDELAGDKRIVITSTDDKRAYYDNLGSLSFSRLYFDQLRRGEDFFNAFETVRRKLPDLGYPFNQQMPQLDDNGDGASNSGRDGNVASQFCLNGCFGGLAGEITLLPNTQNQSLNSQEPITLSVKAGITDGKINRIWALVMTPEAAASRNAQGFALQPTPVVSLAKTDAGNWEGVFDDFKYRGDYIVTFMAEDQDGFVNSAAPITITQLAGDDFQTGDKAIAEKPVYREGEQLQITLPPLPEGQKQYVALNAPGFAELFILNNLNSLLIFDGITLPNWGGSNTVIELPINEFIPRGDYAVYLLRMDVGLDPLINFAQGGLGILQFRVE